MDDYNELKLLLIRQTTLKQLAVKTETIEDENAWLDADDDLQEYVDGKGINMEQIALMLLNERERLSADFDQLKAVNFDYQLGADAASTEIARLEADNEALRNGMVKIIEMNRQHAEDQYGDANKAEAWSCVAVARAAMSIESAVIGISEKRSRAISKRGRDELVDAASKLPQPLPCTFQDWTAVDFHVDQMNEALAGKRFTMPEGMTREQFREWMLDNASSLSGGIRLKLELDRLDAENEALRKLPMIVINEYTELAFAAKGLKTSDRYIQKANGAMDVHRRMQGLMI